MNIKFNLNHKLKMNATTCDQILKIMNEPFNNLNAPTLICNFGFMVVFILYAVCKTKKSKEHHQENYFYKNEQNRFYEIILKKNDD